MSSTDISSSRITADGSEAIARRFWQQEDWLAVIFGLGLVAVAYIFFIGGASLAWIAVTPAKWVTADQLAADFAANWPAPASGPRMALKSPPRRRPRPRLPPAEQPP